MGANITRRQHYVPQCLLRHFTNSAGKLWVYDAKTHKVWTSVPEKIGHERDLYTLQTSAGTADRCLEDLLAEQVDGPGDNAIKVLLARQTLSGEQIRSFFLFVAAQYHRTPAAFALLSALLSPPMSESLRRAAKFEPEFRERVISSLRAVGQTDAMIEEGFAAIERGGCEAKPSTNHLLRLAFDIIIDTARNLGTMRWIFAWVPAGDPDLVLSDHPVSLRRLHAPKEPLGLAYPDVEVTLPLSSRMVAVGRREGKSAYGELNLGAAAAINAQQMRGAKRFVFAGHHAQNLLDEAVRHHGTGPKLHTKQIQWQGRSSIISAFSF
jgi:hypothetical protein